MLTMRYALCGFVLIVAGRIVAAEPPANAQVEPRDVRKVVADGKHNAFTAMVRWRDQFWLAFRKAESHNSSDGDLVVLRSSDGMTWAEAHRVNVLPDDRDPQFLATPARLFLYDPAMQGGSLTSYVTYTDDGESWSKPQPVYQPRYIMWKPFQHGEVFYASAHVKAEGNDGGKVREVHLISSPDGLEWKKVSTIRAGNWESETTLFFADDTQLVGLLRQKYSVPGFILESSPPYTEWQERPAGTHFSGHAVYQFDGVTYVFSRTIDGEKQGTMVYLYADGKLTPYCALPSGGDCSYPAAVRVGESMLVSFYSSHEGATNVYTATVPLRAKSP